VSSVRSFVSVAIVMGLAAAQTPAQASSSNSLAAQLKRCASLVDAGPRLACYDALAGAAAPSASTAQAAPSPSTSGSSGAIPASGAAAAPVAAPAAPATPAAPNFTDFGVRNGPLQAERDPVREKTMLAVVSAVSFRGRGELVVRLDNGQVWRQIQPSDYPLKPGDHVEIDVAALGSYRLWTPSTRRATKVTRIQ
jgi:hypothetical protein